MNSKHIIVGTAGHVDHGKTLLTHALTGVDTDQLPEEKKRGLTIVPGFVPLDLKSGLRLGLIDVPGHERFVKNMLAGAAGIDMALLVVAADEGVMPQTEEHLNILQLLNISKGVVAVTKYDLVDDKGWLRLVHEQIDELLKGSALQDAPIIDVSAVTGYNIDALRDLLDQVAAAVPSRSFTGPCRMPVDRVFSKKGFGTVVTGTLWSGQIEIGERLRLLPTGEELRVRGLQVHAADVVKATSGQRTAINLSGSGTEHLRVGCWLAEPGLLRGSHRLDIILDLLPTAKAVVQRARVRIFHGTMEVMGRVRLLDREILEPGQGCLCQLELEAALYPLRLDRLIIRAYSPVVTIAGATVLDISPIRYKLSAPDTMENIRRKTEMNVVEALQYELDSRAVMLPLSELAKSAQLTKEETLAELSELQVKSLEIEGELQYYSAETDIIWQRRMLETLETYHRKYPMRKGMPTAELRQRVVEQLSTKQYAALLESYASAGLITLSGAIMAQTGFDCTPSPIDQKNLRLIDTAYQNAPFSPPDWKQLTENMYISQADAGEYLAWMVGNGRLVRIGGFLFVPEAVTKAELILRERFITFTLAEARDALGSNRKYTQVLLEYFDANKITVREGDRRHFVS